MRRRVIILLLLILALLTGAEGWWMWREHHPAAPHFVRLEISAMTPPPENILATYSHTFRCTLYYSPQETGFTPEGGFDMSLETKAGLQDHRYPRDFLRAVEMEGFGRLKEPVEGQPYIRYWSKQWGFAAQPIDNHQRPLIAKQSCAISQPYERVQPEALLRVNSPDLPFHFNNLRWKVCDTGSGLKTRQLDLYWGEDDPLGPGKKLCQPKGFEYELNNPTVLVVATAH